MSFIVISSSLNQHSKSALLAGEAYKQLLDLKEDTDWLDLRKVDLPHCDGDHAYNNSSVHQVKKAIEKASCIVLAVPIYNYDCGSSAKNLLELTGSAWEEKTVAFLCAAGGKSSYMSVMSFANSLMLDFRSVIVPRFVYADGGSFKDGKIIDPEIQRRIEQMIATAVKLDAANDKPIMEA